MLCIGVLIQTETHVANTEWLTQILKPQTWFCLFYFCCHCSLPFLSLSLSLKFFENAWVGEGGLSICNEEVEV